MKLNSLKPILHGLFFCLALYSGSAAATSDNPNLDSGDEAFKNRVNEESAKKALVLYRRAYKESKSEDAAWRLAMAAYFVGFRDTPTRTEKIALFSEGRDAALWAISKNPDCAGCHFWAAVNMALYGDSVGILKMLFSLGDVEEHLKRVVAIEPGYMHAGAYRILGIIDKKLPGILGGSKERALEYFKTATALTPTLPLNALFLAQWYESEGDRAHAAEIASKVLKLPIPSQEELEELEAYGELQKLFERVKTPDSRETASAKLPAEAK